METKWRRNELPFQKTECVNNEYMQYAARVMNSDGNTACDVLVCIELRLVYKKWICTRVHSFSLLLVIKSFLLIFEMYHCELFYYYC